MYVHSIRETGLAPRAKNYWEAEACIAMLPLFLGNFKLLQLQYIMHLGQAWGNPSVV